MYSSNPRKLPKGYNLIYWSICISRVNKLFLVIRNKGNNLYFQTEGLTPSKFWLQNKILHVFLLLIFKTLFCVVCFSGNFPSNTFLDKFGSAKVRRDYILNNYLQMFISHIWFSALILPSQSEQEDSEEIVAQQRVLGSRAFPRGSPRGVRPMDSAVWVPCADEGYRRDEVSSHCGN